MNNPRHSFKARRAQAKSKPATVQPPGSGEETPRPDCGDRHSRRLARKQQYRQTGEIA